MAAVIPRAAKYLVRAGLQLLIAHCSSVLVKNICNGRTAVVRINDRRPYGRGRIIDLSRSAARELDMISSGTTQVSIVRQ
jgi:rare lipoprotein A